MRVAVIQFPGSNCDHDCCDALNALPGVSAQLVWHNDVSLPPVDLVVLPGGFSYGDYLRAGAIATQSAIVSAVCAYAEQGGRVLGICNGFQILTEVGLLPGTLMRNTTLKFECRPVRLRVDNRETDFTTAYGPDMVTMPIAHMDGCYYADEETIDALEVHNQVLFRYCDAYGTAAMAGNPNGSQHNIAGICNRQRNVVGMMPHPERAMDPLLGSTDGLPLFESLVQTTHAHTHTRTYAQ
jgi:phosphoribosylformylglycinamidine synthase subunit PurQ / glutaminase